MATCQALRERFTADRPGCWRLVKNAGLRCPAHGGQPYWWEDRRLPRRGDAGIAAPGLLPEEDVESTAAALFTPTVEVEPEHFGFKPHEAWLERLIGELLPSDYEERATPRDVDLSCLRAGQDYLDPLKVARSAATWDATERGAPLVVAFRGELVVWDGHHRIAAALARGMRSAWVRVIDLGG